MPLTVPDNLLPNIDRGELRRALGLLTDPDSTHEVRVLPMGISRTVQGNSLDAAVKAVEEFNGTKYKGIYVTLNPVRDDLKGAARFSDVLCRRRILIDCDPERPSRDDNATDAEKETARLVMDAVLSDLTTRGWPRPIIIDSGNGWHLIYACDLPNDRMTGVLLSNCYKVLKAAHDLPGAKLDGVVHNASRITKLPGTWVRKGDSTPDRPHRMARIVSVPSAFSPVPVEMIQSLAACLVKPSKKTPAWEVPDVSAGGSPSSYVRKALDLECRRVTDAPEGERNNSLNTAAFNLGQLAHLGAVTPGEMSAALSEAALASGLGADEVMKTIRSGFEAGQAVPRQVPERRPDRKTETPFDPIPDHERLTIRASEVVTKKVRWLWKDRVPIGFITLFAGRTGVGKSFVTCDFAARITNGEDMPDGPSGIKGEPRNVLFISEDPYEYVLAPRLLELGADMTRVHFFKWEYLAKYTLADTEMLERAYQDAEQPTFIAIDPPTNFLGECDEHKNAAVRSILMNIVTWLAGKEAACVMITHVNKQSGKGTEALGRVIGSVAWGSTARIVHLFAADPDDPESRLFLPDKTNLGTKAKPLGFKIRQTDALAVIEWTGEVDTTSDAAMAGEKAKPRRVVASEWLTEQFREKREWPSDDLHTAARQQGVSRNALFDAKSSLPIRAKKTTGCTGDVMWSWIAEEGWPPPLEDGD